jgi:lysozyme
MLKLNPIDQIKDAVRGRLTRPLAGEIIDVSHHQGDIDWQAVKSSGVHAAYIRATQGVDLVDRRVRRNLSHANREITHGCYHFGTWYNADARRPEIDAKREADFFVATCELYSPRIWESGFMSPMLDVELSSTKRKTGDPWKHKPGDHMDYSAVRAWMRAWLDRVDKLTGRLSGVYTGRYFVFGDPVTKTRGIGNYSEFVHRPLWYAQYSGKYGPKKPLDGWPPTLWQYTGSGSCPGVSGRVDRNAWLTDKASFLKLCGFDVGTIAKLGPVSFRSDVA